ncbi:MAG: hypothetical protein PVF40_00100 [Ectothiorhodospiraceae bacterium]|jgi:hypothetical protein
MSSDSQKLTGMQRIGLAAFSAGALFTAVMIGYGITGRPLPEWMLAITLLL